MNPVLRSLVFRKKKPSTGEACRTGRRWRFGLALACATVGGSATPDLLATDRWETLTAIHWVENPTNDPAPGAHGELGAYQFRRSTWRSYSSLPFEYARERAHADEVAIKHYEWIRRGFEGAGLAPTSYRIALAWNAGLNAALQGRAPRASHDYARRVVNIVESLKERTANAAQR
jgi:hypothetical protein